MYQFPEEARKYYEALPIPLMFNDVSDGNITPVLVSDGLCKLADAPREKLLYMFGRSIFERLHPDDVGKVAQIGQDFSHKLCPYDVVYRTRYKPDEPYRTIHTVGFWITMPDGMDLTVQIFVDVTKSLREYTGLLDTYALFQHDRFYTDSVTGIPNVNYLREFADAKIASLRRDGEKPCLIVFDVDGMGAYNNRYGMARGDDLLRLTADVLHGELLGSVIVRGKEDHFVVICAFPGKEVCADMVRAVNEKIVQRAYGLTTGVTAGVTMIEQGMDVDTALDRAKRTLRRAGTDLSQVCFFYSRHEDEAYWNERYIVDNFERAMENGWIKVYYQMIMKVATGKGAAMEALARWIDPGRGTISPAEFIPVLKKYHLLYKLDLYMVRQVCREIKIRKENGLVMIPVTFNFCAQDFDHCDVLTEFNAIVEELGPEQYDMEKMDFIVEITEHDVATATEHFKKQLDQLREAGYTVWIDDFGSGYSSLSVFSRFRFDLIKFDMELLQHLDENRGVNRHILRSIVDVAKNMGIHTLAEGVESEEHLEFLRSIGCELAQGFYFSRPGSLDSVLFRLRNSGEIIQCETKEERDKSIQEWEGEHRRF